MRETPVATRGTARTRVRAEVLAWVLGLGALVGGSLALVVAPADAPRFEARLDWPHPAPVGWPREPRGGEFARVEATADRHTLVVTAPTAAAARSLARAFATDGAPATLDLMRQLEGIERRWREEVLAGPLPAPTLETDVAAWLLARARWGRVLAGELPGATTHDPVAVVRPTFAVRTSWNAIDRAARTGDIAALERAFDDASIAEQQWFADREAWRTATRPAQAEAWRTWQTGRATFLEGVAAEVLAAQSSAQRRLAASLARERLLHLGPRLAPQWIAFAAPNVMSLRPAVRPRWTVWLRPVALGALCGALLALLACVVFTGLRPRLAVMPDVEPRLADAARVGPRLHVVCGPQRTAVFRAAFELAAHRLAAGERVLFVDGSARWGLHEVLEREPHWGLLECLAADLPMLGLVQFAGHPGLYLLAHGRHSSAIGWSPLGRKLDEVLPHFGRVMLLLDPQAPAELALGLRGRAVEGWWASPSGRRGRALTEAVSRFGIMFHDLELSDAPEMGLESLAARVVELQPAAGPTVPAPMPEGVRVVGPAVPANPLEPIVLDCDLQVRQRLRFLAWTRRVQAGHRPVASPSSPVAP